MNHILLHKIAITLILIHLFSNTYSQTIEKKTYQTSFTKTAPEIDGLMNDSCWNTVAWSSDFIQSQPYENKPPTQQTSFKILFDDDNLYVFIRAFDTEPKKISRRIGRRNNFDG
ncbi:MAG TPA: sugar-binding protein, partial [Prolixibacteraceae bacterium]|nr:sugar-binding protein [Prolixibacteraceae bacterium]